MEMQENQVIVDMEIMDQVIQEVAQVQRTSGKNRVRNMEKM